MEEILHSEKGFFIGDICYALYEDLYHGVWGDENDYKDGIFTVPEGTQVGDTVLDRDYQFAVFTAKNGDGCYCSNDGGLFSVDSGVLGLVPIELIDFTKVEDLEELGRIEKSTVAQIEYDDGSFTYIFGDGHRVLIETN